MSKEKLLCSVEVTINETLKRLSKIEGDDKKSLQNEFREWINALESEDKNYEVLYINEIN